MKIGSDALDANRKRIVWSLLGCLGLIVVGAAWWLRAGPAPESLSRPSAFVERGPLVISITEAGELESERKKVISNQLRWPVVIREVVPEGTRVKKGETIIRFECKELSDAITQQELDVTTAKNKYIQVSNNLILKRKEMDLMVRKAKQALIDAKADLTRYLEGDWPVQLNDARSAIKLAKRDLELALDDLNFKKKVNANPELDSPYSQSEIKADELKVERLQLKLKRAETELEILMKYNHPREKSRLEMAVADAQISLERAKLEAKTQILLAEADEKAQKTRLDMKMSKLEKLLEDERKLLVRAGQEGLVVYDTGGSRWRPSNVVVEVGEQIRPRQQLMIIPDMTTLQVSTKVYEAMIDQVKIGQQAFIRLDAKPDVVLTGKVARVAVLPDSQNRWLSPGVKVYKVIVKFDRLPKGLKPGMTAQVQLILARLEDALSVPMAAVFTEQEKTYCWRVSGSSIERVPVKIGRMNDVRVQIVAGLSEGDRVLLSPPAVAEREPTEKTGDAGIPIPGRGKSTP